MELLRVMTFEPLRKCCTGVQRSSLTIIAGEPGDEATVTYTYSNMHSVSSKGDLTQSEGGLFCREVLSSVFLHSLASSVKHRKMIIAGMVQTLLWVARSRAVRVRLCVYMLIRLVALHNWIPEFYARIYILYMYLYHDVIDGV